MFAGVYGYCGRGAFALKGESDDMDEHDSEFRDLIEQVRAGSSEAAETLFRKYGHHVLLAARRMLPSNLRARFDSTDFVQAVWASFFVDCVRREDFNDPKQLVAYLTGMARNKVQLEVRKQAGSKKRDIRRENSMADEPNVTSRDPRPSQQAIAKEAWDNLLAGQSQRDQQIINLCLLGFTQNEIATQLDVSDRTVRRVLDRLNQRSE